MEDEFPRLHQALERRRVSAESQRRPGARQSAREREAKGQQEYGNSADLLNTTTHRLLADAYSGDGGDGDIGSGREDEPPEPLPRSWLPSPETAPRGADDARQMHSKYSRSQQRHAHESTDEKAPRRSTDGIAGNTARIPERDLIAVEVHQLQETMRQARAEQFRHLESAARPGNARQQSPMDAFQRSVLDSAGDSLSGLRMAALLNPTAASLDRSSASHPLGGSLSMEIRRAREEAAERLRVYDGPPQVRQWDHDDAAVWENASTEEGPRTPEATDAPLAALPQHLHNALMPYFDKHGRYDRLTAKAPGGEQQEEEHKDGAEKKKMSMKQKTPSTTSDRANRPDEGATQSSGSSMTDETMSTPPMPPTKATATTFLNEALGVDPVVQRSVQRGAGAQSTLDNVLHAMELPEDPTKDEDLAHRQPHELPEAKGSDAYYYRVNGPEWFCVSMDAAGVEPKQQHQHQQHQHQQDGQEPQQQQHPQPQPHAHPQQDATHQHQQASGLVPHHHHHHHHRHGRASIAISTQRGAEEAGEDGEAGGENQLVSLERTSAGIRWELDLLMQSCAATRDGMDGAENRGEELKHQSTQRDVGVSTDTALLPGAPPAARMWLPPNHRPRHARMARKASANEHAYLAQEDDGALLQRLNDEESDPLNRLRSIVPSALGAVCGLHTVPMVHESEHGSGLPESLQQTGPPISAGANRHQGTQTMTQEAPTGGAVPPARSIAPAEHAPLAVQSSEPRPHQPVGVPFVHHTAVRSAMDAVSGRPQGQPQHHQHEQHTRPHRRSRHNRRHRSATRTTSPISAATSRSSASLASSRAGGNKDAAHVVAPGITPPRGHNHLWTPSSASLTTKPSLQAAGPGGAISQVVVDPYHDPATVLMHARSRRAELQHYLTS